MFLTQIGHVHHLVIQRGRQRFPAYRRGADAARQVSKTGFHYDTWTADAKRSSSSRLSLLMSMLLKGGESGPSDMIVITADTRYTMINMNNKRI